MNEDKPQSEPADTRRHETYDPRERIRNLAGTEPETREDDEYTAKAQSALSSPTQNAGSRSNPS